MTKTSRAIHLTFQKCGSQWVAYLLGDPEIGAQTGMAFHVSGADVRFKSWPQQPTSSFMAPVYGASLADWQTHRREGDKAVVVIRDPRDMVVSLVYSLCYSHRAGTHVAFVRDFLLPLNLRRRMAWGIEQTIHKYKTLLSWARRDTSETEIVMRYEDLVAAPEAEFARILSFLRWDISQDLLQRVVKRHSFAHRSGREPGEEDIFSHFRKGTPGDWRDLFDRKLGKVWEELLPGLVCSLGYESDDRWYETLPEKSEVSAVPEEQVQFRTAVELESEVARIREENAELRRGLTAFREYSAELERQLSQLRASSGVNR